MSDKLVKYLRIFSISILIVILITLIINLSDHRIEFANPHFNNLYGFIICYLVFVFFAISFLIIRFYKKPFKIIISILSIPSILLSLVLLLVQHGQMDEQKYDVHKAYQDVNRDNRFILVQKHRNYKHHDIRIDTSLIHSYWIFRHIDVIDSLDITGKWIKYSPDEKIIDTIKID